MTYDQLAEYLAQGGHDLRVVLEAIEESCPDERTRGLIGDLFANLDEL